MSHERSTSAKENMYVSTNESDKIWFIAEDVVFVQQNLLDDKSKRNEISDVLFNIPLFLGH